MLQVASFTLPSEQDKANEFLKTHKPMGQVSFNKDIIVVFWEDGEYPAEYEIADLRELLQSNKMAKLQQEIALHVMKAELADTPTNMARYNELSAGIKGLETGLSIQDIKADFVQKRIDSLTGNSN